MLLVGVGSSVDCMRQNLSFNNPPDSPTPESINLQRRKLQETQKLHLALVNETARNEALLGQLRSLLSSTRPNNSSFQPKQEDAESDSIIADEDTKPAIFEFLTEDPSAKELGVGTRSKAPLTTNVNFALSQLPALKSLLSTLRPKLHTLPSAASKVDWDNTREERKQYIESQTRRHLERTRGLQLDEQGAMRDGEWTGVGRKVNAEDVTAMENVVEILRREPDDRMEE